MTTLTSIVRGCIAHLDKGGTLARRRREGSEVMMVSYRLYEFAVVTTAIAGVLTGIVIGLFAAGG